jgi:heme a synthase
VVSALARLRDALPVGVSTTWLRRILLANLVGQIVIVLTGGVVRLTGSGLGCPTFPQCVPGSYTPVVTQPQGFHRYIEFGNRMMTTVLTALATAALLAVLRYVRAGGGAHRRRLLVLGAIPLLGVAVQALIGGITVLTELNPAVVAVHFLVSMALIAGSTLLVLEALAPAAGGGWTATRPVSALTVAVTLVAAVVLSLGTLVTGSGPHSGDADDPNRFGFHIAVVARMHSGAVWLFVLLVVALVWALARPDAPSGARTARRGAGVLLAVTLAQGVIGYAQYALGVPVVLVALHMLGAALLVVSTTYTAFQVLRRAPQFVPAAALGEFGPLPGEDETHEPLPVQR